MILWIVAAHLSSFTFAWSQTWQLSILRKALMAVGLITIAKLDPGDHGVYAAVLVVLGGYDGVCEK